MEADLQSCGPCRTALVWSGISVADQNGEGWVELRF